MNSSANRGRPPSGHGGAPGVRLAGERPRAGGGAGAGHDLPAERVAPTGGSGASGPAPERRPLADHEVGSGQLT